MNPQRTTAFLMANLGTEIMRLFNFKKAGNMERARSSADRASKIVEALESHPKINGGRREVEMIRDVMIHDTMSEKPKYHLTLENLTAYFMPFSKRALAENGIV